jgi:superfamily II DNA/RNA helicase
MLKMGFKDDIEKILEKVKEVRKKEELQILLFSATVPESLREIATEYMKQDFRVVDLA